MYPGFLSPQAFGHTGFTGTLLVIDPVKKLIIIFLTNAVHPHVRLDIMQPMRKKLIQLVQTAFGAKL
jgi:CubicO group peptidase (beta-lactamase class C family)